MLRFKNTSSDRSLSHILAVFGRNTMLPWLKTLFTGALEAGTARVCCTDGISLSYTALLRTQKSTGFESQSPSVPSHVSIWLKGPMLKHYISPSVTAVFCRFYTDLQACNEVVCHYVIVLPFS